MSKNTIVLAHYYVEPEVQQMADYVGDSLELSLRARQSDAKRIVFAGVKFMAETAKIINPKATVLIPDIEATCSLVVQSEHRKFHGDYNLEDTIHHVRSTYPGIKIVTYINSSAKIKALSDVIVTSANVEDIISDLIAWGNTVYFTPDRNMGAYLAFNNPTWEDKFKYYENAVCEVHDKFKAEEVMAAMAGWYDYGKYMIAHPESPLPVLQQADFVGSTSKMINWIKDVPEDSKAIYYVATEDGLLYNMREARPDLDIRLAPMYTGCQCNSCPFMKKNTAQLVKSTVEGFAGTEIDYISENIRVGAEKSINAMLNWRN